MSQPFQAADDPTRAVWHQGALVQLRVIGAQTGGRFALTEHLCGRGAAAPLHRHTMQDELFLVLDGELSITVDGNRFRARSGSITFAPRGLPHCYHVESDRCRFLALITPAGFEQWFVDTGLPAGDLSLPPTHTSPPDVAALISAAARYGVEILGPPPSVAGP
ncbi:cupin domain-containing protein [Nocardia otitidiscaviarum]|uniref:cupin domain-containing protein n=1 Tax=Nocardia otitidiscaviarum TaxID=1823 RepID=UPI00189584C9|nr:cupin domain-containing protein [Nocardia otitidiscaviarum]MBF6180797.1 cupin domain-containing protein [Nocardia otitidiscaviarum]